MEEKQSQTAEETVRPSPALSWNKKTSKPPTKAVPVSGEPDQAAAEKIAKNVISIQTGTDIGEKKNRKTRKPTSTQPAKVTGYLPKHYEYLSTKARRSIQEALTELSHIRSKSGHEVTTIKLFIEEAVTLWKTSPKSKLEYKAGTSRPQHRKKDDPLDSFNNQIEYELKLFLKDVCHERGKRAHPVSTIIAILDEALLLWLPLQKDLPGPYLEAVLQSSQKTEAVVE